MVPNGQSLLLVGGDVKLDGGELTAEGGRIELGGVSEPGTVALNMDANNLRLSFPQGVQRGDVSLTKLRLIVLG
ncbi:two-partner secretion domain-containing protein [Nostoc sp.]|uniref:two-partner secretion domain-containing protein n=1 Tax=Nostoc sp. TaxID=1180 RepID=UPI002FF97F8D